METRKTQQFHRNGWKSWGLALLLGLSISMAGCKGDVSALDAALGKIGVDTGSGAGSDAPAIPAFSLIPVSGNLQTAATLAQFANPLKVQALQQG